MFLSTSADGGCHLLNADPDPAEPVRLALTLQKSSFSHSRSRDLALPWKRRHASHCRGSTGIMTPSIVWHRIDPVSGTTLGSVHKDAHG